MRNVFLFIFLLLPFSLFGAFTFKEDFSKYKEGSDASPTWQTSSINWRVEKGLIINDDLGKSNLILHKSPYGRVLTLSANVIVRERKSTDWKIAGITVYLDSGHFWHLALVEAPEYQGYRHFAELAQMLDGEWNTQGRLKMVSDGGFDGFNWEYNQPYRLEMKLTGEGIEGSIYDAQGNLLAKRSYLFEDKQAVKFGKVGLTNSGFLTAFDDVEVNIMEEEKYSPPKPAYPPYKGKGWNGIKSQAKGFFYTKEINGVWWLIDPDGNAFYSVGTDHCNYYVHGSEILGYAPYNKFVSQKYGSEEKWGDSAAKRLLSWGFTSLGTNSSRGVRYKGLPHTEFAGLGASFARIDYITKPINWTGFPNVFHPKFEEYCMKQAKEICSPHKDDPWLIGYFIDNELEWYGKGGKEWGLVDDIFRLPPGNSAKIALINFLKEKYKDIKAFNKAWGVKLASFAQLDSLTEPIQPTTEQGIKDKIEFVGIIAERYFKITTKAIKAADPNHLVLGCRFAWDAPAPAWSAAGKYCDVVSVNMYPWVDLKTEKVRDVEELLTKHYKQTHKPFMLTEWSFPALDSGLPCTHGAGERFATQEERAKAFAIFQNLLFRLPFMVGSHYFMWVDEPKEGISRGFPENTNYGLVNEKDEPYVLLVDTASKLNPLVYHIHAGLVPRPTIEVGKETITVSNKGKADDVELRIKINGEEEIRNIHLSQETKIKYQLPTSPGAYLVIVRAYWRGLKIGETSKVIYRKGVWAEGKRRVILTVINEGGETCRNLPLSIPLNALPIKLGKNEGIVAYDALGKPVPTIYDPTSGDISLQISELQPEAAYLIYLYPSSMKAEQKEPRINVNKDDNKFQIDNGILRLVKEEDDGDLVDAIYYKDTKLGKYQALIREDLSQPLWVAPNKIERMEINKSTDRVCVDIIARFDGEKAITEVGEKGEFAPQRVQPLSFRVAYRLIVYPDVPWFIGKFLWVENTSPNPLSLGAYFHYPLSEIGGDTNNDAPDGTPTRWCYIHQKEETVPSYYDAMPGASWVDKEIPAWYGAIPIWGGKYNFYFWKDEGGREHPDIWKEVKTTLAPKQIFREENGAILLYGCVGAGSYEKLISELKGWQEVKLEIGKLEVK